MPSEERVRSSNMVAFQDLLREEEGVSFTDYDALHAWSVEEPEAFWYAVAQFGQVTVQTWGKDRLEKEDILVDGDKLPGALWFPGARLNFAENLLQRRDSRPALIFRGEDQVRRELSFCELYDAVSTLAQAMREAGVVSGDRVGAYLPNMPEAIIAMLAAASIGATWSSCSPDFGVRGVLDRFGQIEPKVLFVVDGYYYGGKTHNRGERNRAIVEALPSVETVVVVNYSGESDATEGMAHAVTWEAFTEPYNSGDVRFEQLPFDHPLYIMFSSGTTGVPKCIVHGAGGTLLKHLCEHQLHCDTKAGDRVFYFTTCGWMMWNWLVSALSVGATLILYDGSPFYPDGNALFDMADEERMTFFGTSAKFIDALNKAGIKPAETHDLSRVRVLASTGSPLVPESFDFVYQHIKSDIQLASIAGGTDIIGCFVLGNPAGGVYRGEIQCKALGVDVRVFDGNGRAVVGEKGELVCCTPFPSMPVGFWNDPGGEKFHAAYFDVYPNTWRHGDWVELTERGGMVIYGRSDATLNPGGVRIGTAEIYRVVEKLDAIMESIVIGQEWEGDTRVVLFVVLREGLDLNDALQTEIRRAVRAECSPRHVPACIVAVTDIPRTKSGKITEIAVRDVVHGRPIKNKEALANPEALALYQGLSELES